MKVLVAGAAGFLGSHLSERLLSDGHEVIGVDNFFTGSKRNVAHLLDYSAFELVRHDITFPLYLECEAILNFACPASPFHYQKFPVQTMKTNVHGAINLLGLAKRTGARILQASTSEVYGDPEEHPQTEKYRGHVNPLGPRACYDEGKRAAETLFMDYHRQFGLDVRIVRIFNTYGPRMANDDGRVVSNFIVSALKGRPITIYGDGSQTRSLCFVDDLTDGILRMLRTEGITGPINLGSTFEISMTGLAGLILELSNSKSSLSFEALPVDDPRQRRPDLTLAKEILDWEPKIDLKEGLLKTIEYFKEQLR